MAEVADQKLDPISEQETEESRIEETTEPESEKPKEFDWTQGDATIGTAQ